MVNVVIMTFLLQRRMPMMYPWQMGTMHDNVSKDNEKNEAGSGFGNYSIKGGQQWDKNVSVLRIPSSCTEKKTRATVLNPHRAKEFAVPSTLTRYIAQLCSFLLNIPCTFFNATHQVKAIAKAVSKVNPLVEIDWCDVMCTSKRILPMILVK